VTTTIEHEKWIKGFDKLQGIPTSLRQAINVHVCADNTAKPIGLLAKGGQILAKGDAHRAATCRPIVNGLAQVIHCQRTERA
jgi:hypothetical protein